MEIADLVTDRAILIGAANTLIFRKDGKIHADNTDGYGFLENLKQGPRSGTQVRSRCDSWGRWCRARCYCVLVRGWCPRNYAVQPNTRAAEKLQKDFGNRVACMIGFRRAI